jgi:hypothetical protein
MTSVKPKISLFLVQSLEDLTCDEIDKRLPDIDISNKVSIPYPILSGWSHMNLSEISSILRERLDSTSSQISTCNYRTPLPSAFALCKVLGCLDCAEGATVVIHGKNVNNDFKGVLENTIWFEPFNLDIKHMTL